MKSKLAITVFLLITGCDLFQYEDFRYYPSGSATSALMAYQFVSNTSTEVIYDVSIAHVNYYNDIYYDAVNYDLNGNGTLAIQTLNGMEATAIGNSSTLVLLDQSGSYVEIDPHNYRTKCINALLENFSSPNNFLFGSFSSKDQPANTAVEFANLEFASQWQNRDFLFDLVERTGGMSRLYDATSAAIDKLAASSATRKNLVVVTHANDASSGSTFSSIIINAISKSVKVHVIALGDQPSPATLWDLTQLTGGILALSPSDLHMITAIQHLERFINRTTYISKLRIKFQPSGGNVMSGNVYENQIKVIDGAIDYKFNPVYIKIKIP